MPHHPAAAVLDHVKVLDLTRVRSGPTCVRQLADWGADVIKVEMPPAVEGGAALGGSRHGSDFQNLHRNKRSLALDLKAEAGKEVFRKLVANADVVVENYRPDVKNRLGIDYENVMAWKENIVYAAATGYGEAGPYVDRPAYDDLIQGASGLAGLFGAVTGTPRYGPSVLADKTTGLYLTYAITMALFHRERTGEGQRLHVPMYEAFAGFIMNEHMQGRAYEPPLSEAGYQRMLTPHRRPYPTADGHICVLPYNDKHWAKFFELAGRPELTQDARFADQPSRSENIDALYEIVGGIMQTRTSSDWQATLEAADIPVMPMNTPEDLFDCPHLEAVGMFPEVDHPTEGRTRHLKVPIHFSKTPGGYYRHPEHVGQSTDDVLAEVGYSQDDIAALRSAGAMGKGEPA